MRSPESQNHIFNGWSECVSVVSIIQKLIAAETLNSVFHMRIIYKFYLKLFIKIKINNLCIGAEKKFETLQPKTEFLVSEFPYIQIALNLMKVTYVFNVLKNT